MCSLNLIGSFEREEEGISRICRMCIFARTYVAGLYDIHCAATSISILGLGMFQEHILCGLSVSTCYISYYPREKMVDHFQNVLEH